MEEDGNTLHDSEHSISGECVNIEEIVSIAELDSLALLEQDDGRCILFRNDCRIVRKGIYLQL